MLRGALEMAEAELEQVKTERDRLRRELDRQGRRNGVKRERLARNLHHQRAMNKRLRDTLICALAHASVVRLAHAPTCPVSPGVWVADGQIVHGSQGEEACICWVRDAKLLVAPTEPETQLESQDRPATKEGE